MALRATSEFFPWHVYTPLKLWTALCWRQVQSHETTLFSQAKRSGMLVAVGAGDSLESRMLSEPLAILRKKNWPSLTEDAASSTGSAQQMLRGLQILRAFCLDQERPTFFKVDFKDKERATDE